MNRRLELSHPDRLLEVGTGVACGNAMDFKPAQQTPLTTSRFAEIYTEAGVPAGVFNVVHGPASTGWVLSLHPDIAKLSLTSEVATGRRVMADATSTLKNVTMGLGDVDCPY